MSARGVALAPLRRRITASDAQSEHALQGVAVGFIRFRGFALIAELGENVGEEEEAEEEKAEGCEGKFSSVFMLVRRRGRVPWSSAQPGWRMMMIGIQSGARDMLYEAATCNCPFSIA
jgi:hypothetical protein